MRKHKKDQRENMKKIMKMGVLGALSGLAMVRALKNKSKIERVEQEMGNLVSDCGKHALFTDVDVEGLKEDSMDFQERFAYLEEEIQELQTRLDIMEDEVGVSYEHMDSLYTLLDEGMGQGAVR